MTLPSGFLDDLRARVSLSALVGRSVTWDRARSQPGKGDWWAPCPFHSEKTASFHVDDRKGYYYCFGCQAKGDAVTFLRETRNLGFMEAVEALAAEAGVPMPARDPGAARRAEARKGLAEVMEACVRHCRLQLQTAAGAEARAYLARRGLDAEMLARFEIGFAPDLRRGLVEAMAGKLDTDDLVRAGMLIAPEDGGAPYDRFRGRIMFPIRDGQGRCIAFGGRAMDPNARAKYLNSPETELFDKGRSLYNLGPAREAAGKAGRLVVAEGYMDVIALTRAGVPEAVAPLGTAVTESQLQMLWRLADEPVVALDGDAAGRRAAGKLADLALGLLAPGKSLRFCLLPEGRDPDDLLREGGPAAVAAALAKTVALDALVWDRLVEGRDLAAPERRAAFDAELRALLRRIPDPGVRAHYAEAMRARRAALFGPAAGARTGFGRRAGFGGLRGSAFGGLRGGGFAGGRFGFAEASAGPPRPETRASALGSGAGAVRLREARLLAGALHHPVLAARHEEALRDLPSVDAELTGLREALLDLAPAALEAPDPAAALRAALTGRLGGDPFARLGAGPDPALAPGAPAARAAAAFAEALARHALMASALAEAEAAAAEISAETADEISHRLAYINREREAAARSRPDSDPAGTDPDGPDDPAARLRAIEAAQPWVRRGRRQGP